MSLNFIEPCDPGVCTSLVALGHCLGPFLAILVLGSTCDPLICKGEGGHVTVWDADLSHFQP